jgi:hypothetical protein
VSKHDDADMAEGPRDHYQITDVAVAETGAHVLEQNRADDSAEF